MLCSTFSYCAVQETGRPGVLFDADVACVLVWGWMYLRVRSAGEVGGVQVRDGCSMRRGHGERGEGSSMVGLRGVRCRQLVWGGTKRRGIKDARQLEEEDGAEKDIVK
jgi:hypothetical protein